MKIKFLKSLLHYLLPATCSADVVLSMHHVVWKKNPRFLKSLLLPLLLTTCYMLLLSSSASAGTIIKGPAYLGLQRGLVGCWTFDGAYRDAPDCSGNNNTGTINGATKTNGKIGQALSFDGVNDYVPINDPNNSFLDITGPISICVWFNTNSVAAGDRALVSDHADGQAAQGYNFELTGDDLYFSWQSDTEPIETYTTTANIFQTGVWYYACGIRVSNSEVRFYVNGVNYSATWNGSNDTPDVIGTTSIGRLGDTDLDYFNGLIDDVRIYNRALSANEIARLYRVGLGSTTNRSSNSLTSGLIGCWTFDGAYTNVPDCSGNNNVGIIAGGPTKVGGKIGQALKFDGAGAKTVTFGTIQNSPDDWTWTIWFYPLDKIDNNTVGLIGEVNNPRLTWLSGAGGDPKVDFFASFQAGGNAFGPSSGNLANNQWYHAVLTVTGASTAAPVAKLYINSVLKDTENYAAAINPPDSSLAVNVRDAVRTFNGFIDEARIYNRALSANEIARLYNQTQGRTNSPQTDFLKKGLVGYWTFDGADTHSNGETDDKSGNGNTGTLTGGPTKVAGKIGQALSFDGLNDEVDLLRTSGLPLYNNTAYSFTAWVKGGKQADKTIYADIGNTANFQIAVDASGNTGKVNMWLRNDAGGVLLNDVLSTGIAFNNSWHHIAWTDNNGTTALYIDGVRDATNFNYTRTGAFTFNQSSRIGSANGLLFFNGLIDDVRAYNRALSAGEVNKLYQMGR